MSSAGQNGGIEKTEKFTSNTLEGIEHLPILPIFEPILAPPGSQFEGNGFSEVSESAKNESSWAKNGGVEKEMSVL